MIQLTGAAKRFGPKTLFENLDWLVTTNERAGIVGANGTGKSTLLKILAGIDGLDAGTIVTMKGASIGYLPQEGLSLSGRTVFAECMTVFADLLALEQEQETLAHKMSSIAYCAFRGDRLSRLRTKTTGPSPAGWYWFAGTNPGFSAWISTF